MSKREFNGHEVAFLTGNSEDSGTRNFIIASEKLGVGEDGCEQERVVVKHPDGKFYQFIFKYNTEHGILPCREWPNQMTVATEVEPYETVIVAYRPVGD